MNPQAPDARLRVRLSLTVALLMSITVTAVNAGTPSGCADISTIAPFTQFRFDQFQAIFDTLTDPKNPNSQLCTSCHPGESGPAGLGLGQGFSYANLVGVPSVEIPSLLRVAPGSPLQSYFFLKINCDTQPIGTQMPQGSPPLSLTQQAFFYDWIRLGAPLSRLGFEDR